MQICQLWAPASFNPNCSQLLESTAVHWWIIHHSKGKKLQDICRVFSFAVMSTSILTSLHWASIFVVQHGKAILFVRIILHAFLFRMTCCTCLLWWAVSELYALKCDEFEPKRKEISLKTVLTVIFSWNVSICGNSGPICTSCNRTITQRICFQKSTRLLKSVYACRSYSTSKL